MISRWIPILLLIVANALVWSIPIHQGLTVSFLNIGQGDAIFIQGPTGVQMLVDGGPDSSVLRELGTQMPFWDRTLDAVMESHPDKDHIAGLVDVLKRYEVKTFIEPGISNDTRPTVALVQAVKSEHSKNILARRGMRLDLGGGAYADILFPDRDVSKVETNTGSVVMHLVYGETSFLLNGDSPQVIEKYLVALDPASLKSDVLKAGHHGSKTSSASEFVEAVNPKYGVFSRGCDNSYGHPSTEVVALFRKLKIPTFDTCKVGTVTFESNGETLRVSER